MSRGKPKDLTGRKFGRLTVIRMTDERRSRHVVWECLCDCGNRHFVPSNSLLSGKTKSCGCFMIESRGVSRITHHMSNEKIYAVWQKMRKRCYYKSDKNYKDYGGRGIVVCDDWNSDFKRFYDYVSQLPHFGELGYSLDRINNDGNYEPGNVRWATQTEQGRNRRNCITITANGETRTAIEWAELLGVHPNKIYYRIKHGKSIFPSEQNTYIKEKEQCPIL